MNPGEIIITDVFARPVGGGALDDTLPWAGPNQIVARIDVGAIENAKPVPPNPAITVQVSIWDHTTGGLLGGGPIPLAVTAGPFPDTDNENSSYEAVSGPIPPLGAGPGGVYEPVVTLIRGTTITSSYRGPLFFGV
jgi:hypothetical protein